MQYSTASLVLSPTERLLNVEAKTSDGVTTNRAHSMLQVGDWLLLWQDRGVGRDGQRDYRISHPDGRVLLLVGQLPTSCNALLTPTATDASLAKAVDALTHVFEAAWDAAAEGLAGAPARQVLVDAVFGLSSGDAAAWKQGLGLFLTNHQIQNFAKSGWTPDALRNWWSTDPTQITSLPYLTAAELQQSKMCAENGWTAVEYRAFQQKVRDLRKPTTRGWADLPAELASLAVQAGMRVSEAKRLHAAGRLDAAGLRTLIALRTGSSATV